MVYASCFARETTAIVNMKCTPCYAVNYGGALRGETKLARRVHVNLATFQVFRGLQ